MSYFLLARSGPNTVDLRIVPVIVIPGIMGSRLRMSDATAPTWDIGLQGWPAEGPASDPSRGRCATLPDPYSGRTP